MRKGAKLRKTIILLLSIGITWGISCSQKQPELVAVSESKDVKREIKLSDFTLTFDLVLGYSPVKEDLVSNDIVSSKDRKVQSKLAKDQSILKKILEKCAEYCEKLEGSFLYFVCKEKISEETYRLKRLLKAGSWVHHILIKNNYVYDYQLIRKHNKIEEKRTLIEENGQEMNLENAQLKTIRFHFENILFGPFAFLSKEGQKLYDFKLVGGEKLRGERTIVLEARSVSASKKNLLSGRVWIKSTDFKIVKIEWNQGSIGGIKILKSISKSLGMEPQIKLMAEYGFEKNGIRFISTFSIKEVYVSNKEPYRFVKSLTSVEYSDYKFFTVETKVKYVK